MSDWVGDSFRLAKLGACELVLLEKFLLIALFPVSTIEYPTLEMVDIFFGAATYDEIEKDVKVTLEAALGLIGGTMGLLTGFSILSGVEIIYFVMKFLWKFWRKKK